ncbi:MAG: leucyl aminopeptidase [Nocardioidaceae bacterium]
MTTYTLRKGAADKTKTDAVVVGVVRTPQGLAPAPGGEGVAGAYGRKLVPMLSTLGFTAKRDEVLAVPTGGVLKSTLLVLVGLGEADAVTPSVVRRAAGVAARALPNAASVSLALPAGDTAHLRAVVEGFELGGYTFSSFKSAQPPERPGEVVVLSEVARTTEAAEALATARTIAAATALARDWVNTPAGDLTPPVFADAVVAETKHHKGVKATVLDEHELEERGFGGIIGVGQGSDAPPRLVTLTYHPKGATTHVALVGKGITFDSGGLTLKTAASMRTMKSDMGGAAAVVAATFAIADLGLPVAVTAYVPMAENMVSGRSTRPGDVLTMYGGTTVEVLNPDAEGRLILADALVLAREAQPDLIVDVATLTGACEQALGDRVSGLLGNDEALVARVRAAGERAGEPLWPLPIPAEMPVKVRTHSKVADLMQHNVDRYGGALYASAFLAEFAGDTPWAHLDICGPSFNGRGAWGHVTPGGTGVGVASLVELAADLSS